MKVIYDPKTDTLSVVFKPGPVAESDEQKPGVILDYDDKGCLVGLEILEASKSMPDLTSVEFRVCI